MVTTTLTVVKYFYLLMAGLGAVVPWTYNAMALAEIGAGFTPQAFFLVGFQGSAMLGSLAADFWIGATASIVWMLIEARRLKMRFWWALLPLTLLVAWACALPLFLYLRERQLERSAVEPAGRPPAA